MRWEARTSKAEEIPGLYESGGEGVVFDPAEQERCLEGVAASGNNPNGAELAQELGFAGSFAGKLVTPFLHVQRAYPAAWPGPAQEVGDCVSHSARNAILGSLVCEVAAGLPDEESRKLERLPEVSEIGERNGVLCSETHYWHRRKASHGWFIGAAARVILSKSGAVVRRDYPGEIDLTQYSGSMASRYGAQAPPDSIVEITNDHLFRTATEMQGVEEWRDYLGRGFFLGTDGSEGFSRRRDANGVSERSGSWSHSMACIGYDDREETHRIYGCGLALILNSWGARWISGPRRIRGTDIDIPEGSFWAKTSSFRRRAVAFSGCNGWVRKALPDLSPGFK